ncbi:hypothetical protein GCM10009764_55680 [Nocardia ninae]|uniref:Uncharacterized protein n=1 Tax=Nocardia ninae NBRC 108245 TaxID=1210091 RepID=A0A511M582_9NOCA|nr:hypothetical protein NN4_02990 [Nocardia ninae NBRC 108245]
MGCAARRDVCRRRACVRGICWSGTADGDVGLSGSATAEALLCDVTGGVGHATGREVWLSCGPWVAYWWRATGRDVRLGSAAGREFWLRRAHRRRATSRCVGLRRTTGREVWLSCGPWVAY